MACPLAPSTSNTVGSKLSISLNSWAKSWPNFCKQTTVVDLFRFKCSQCSMPFPVCWNSKTCSLSTRWIRSNDFKRVRMNYSTSNWNMSQIPREKEMRSLIRELLQVYSDDWYYNSILAAYSQHIKTKMSTVNILEWWSNHSSVRTELWHPGLLQGQKYQQILASNG